MANDLLADESFRWLTEHSPVDAQELVWQVEIGLPLVDVLRRSKAWKKEILALARIEGRDAIWREER
jgi:hypothetical protein